MRIPFDHEARTRYFQLLDQVFDSNFWSEGRMQRTFEEQFGEFIGCGARAVANAGAGLLAMLDYVNVAGAEVVVPANTFWATAQAVRKAGGTPVYADCSKADLCLGLEDVEKAVTPKTKAVIVVHIGGHICFEIDAIAEFCERKGLVLLEDCAHAHGATWNGRSAGSFGFAGVYSFYATKSLPTGDGGMVVSRDLGFLTWVEKYRNYGKEIVNGTVTYPIANGYNYRMNEVTAALGVVQLERFPEILAWKRALAVKFDQIFENRVRLPEGMVSGYYKYVVFGYDNLTQATGQVFGHGDLGYRIQGLDITLPKSEWVTAKHKCPPIWYGWEHADKSVDELRALLLGEG